MVMPAVRAIVPDDGSDPSPAHGNDDLPRHSRRFDNILDAIGYTPLVEIPRMSPNPNVRIFAKLEMLNPTGSVKDRVAKYLIEDLERRGRLGPIRSSWSRHRATRDPLAMIGGARVTGGAGDA